MDISVLNSEQRKAAERQLDLWQAWRSPASLLTQWVRGSYEIDHLKGQHQYIAFTLKNQQKKNDLP